MTRVDAVASAARDRLGIGAAIPCGGGDDVAKH